MFVQKVGDFLEFARSNAELQSGGKLKCPCAKCRNVPFLDVEDIKFHLYSKGFCPNYYRWIFHGERHLEDFINPRVEPTTSSPSSNPIRNMIIDAFGPMGGNDGGEGLNNVEEEDPHPEAKAFFDMLKDARNPCMMGLTCLYYQ
ncbi:Serine--tRNA ligase [Bienertia sinuspersici]